MVHLLFPVMKIIQHSIIPLSKTNESHKQLFPTISVYLVSDAIQVTR